MADTSPWHPQAYGPQKPTARKRKAAKLRPFHWSYSFTSCC